jgi:hypothetical protein
MIIMLLRGAFAAIKKINLVCKTIFHQELISGLICPILSS